MAPAWIGGSMRSMGSTAALSIRVPAVDGKRMLCLRRGEFLPLRQAQGRVVAVISGQLWVSQGAGARDAFVGAGEALELDLPDAAMLHALEPSHLLVLDRGDGVTNPGWFERLRLAARRWGRRVLTGSR